MSDVLDSADSVDSAALADRLERLAATDPRYGHLGDVVVLHRGEVAAERSLQPGRLRNTFSVTKTLTAMLVGMTGVAVDEPVPDVGASPAELLSMRLGMRTDEEDIDRVRELPEGWREWMLARPREVPPGTEFRYDNCAYELLGYWLADRLGTTLEEYAAVRLFAPLGITEWSWPADPDGCSWASGEVALGARDLARVGRLLTGARPDVLPDGWRAAMTAPTSAGGPPERLPYGYGVWLGAGYVLLAGWAGQSVHVVPDRDLVAVCTGLPDLLAPDWRSCRSVVEEWLRGGDRGR